MATITTIEIPDGMTPEEAQRALRAHVPVIRQAPQPPPPRVTSGSVPDSEALLTPAEVAAMFRVDPKTVTRWAKAGKLTSLRTPGGHRRYREAEVRALLAGVPQRTAA